MRQHRQHAPVTPIAARRRIAGWLGPGLIVLSACSGRDTAPPVASVSVVVEPARAPAGSPVEFTYRFVVAPDATIDSDFRVGVDLADADGRTVWSDDHAPPVPTSEWRPGRVVQYSRTVFLPRTLAPGDVDVDVGLYASDLRLPLASPDGARAPGRDRSYRVAALQLLPESENIFVIFQSGWHAEEFGEGAPDVSWRWSGRSAVVAFPNPGTDVTLYLEFDARPEVFAGAPQQVTVTSNATDRVLDRLSADSAARRLVRIAVPAESLGTSEMASIRFDVDRTFVPAALPAGGRDNRALGIRVYHVFVGRR